MSKIARVLVTTVIAPLLLASCDAASYQPLSPNPPVAFHEHGSGTDEVTEHPRLSRFFPPLPAPRGRFGPTDPTLLQHTVLIVCEGYGNDLDSCGRPGIALETTYDEATDSYGAMWYPPDPVIPGTLYRLRVMVGELPLGRTDLEPIGRRRDGSLIGLRLPGARRLLTDEIPVQVRFRILRDPRILAHLARLHGTSVAEAVLSLLGTFPTVGDVPDVFHAIVAEYGPRAARSDDEWVAAALVLGNQFVQRFGRSGPPIHKLRQLANALRRHFELTRDEAQAGLLAAGVPPDVVERILSELYGPATVGGPFN